ncbi:MAG: hypothetical protein ACKVVT_08180 [Dehalococcoidia bacterium]
MQALAPYYDIRLHVGAAGSPRAVSDAVRDILFAANTERQLLGRESVSGVTVASCGGGSPPRTALDLEAAGHAIVLRGQPLPLPPLPDPEPVELAPGDAPFYMVHVLRFSEGGRAAMAGYGASAGLEGVKLGVRPIAYFTVERSWPESAGAWDEVRLNRFPSHAVFEQLRANPVHQSGQTDRQSALADSYSLMLRPSLDRLTELRSH